MNKLLLFSTFILSGFFCLAQDNGGFEMWDETPTYSNPDVEPSNFASGNDQFYWAVGLIPVTEVSGVTGSGLRMETMIVNDETIAGYAIWGDVPDGDSEPFIFPGGFPFTDANVTGLTVSMRYDIDVTSPGFVWIQFKNNGELVTGGQDGNGNYFFEVSGMQSTWESFTFNFDQPLTSTPDECSIIFASNDILSDPSTGFEGDFLEIDNVMLNGTMELVPGGNLDTWIDLPPVLRPADWEVLYSPFFDTFEQSTDAYEGEFSLKLNTLLGSENDTIVSAAYQGVANDDGILATIPLVDDAESLDFWYKYDAVDGDQAIVFLVLSDDLENDEDGLYFLPYFIDAAADWTMATMDFSDVTDDIDFQYYAIIAFSSPIDDLGAPHPGSSLWLDAFSFNLEEGSCAHDPAILDEPPTLCPDEMATLGTQEWDSYQWYQQLGNFGDPILIEGATGQTFDVDGTYAGYSIWCETTSDGCTESTTAVLIDGYVFAPVVISGDGTTELCEGQSTELTVGGGPFETYQWLDDGNDIMGAMSDSFTVTETGSYTVIVTASECPNYEMTNGISVDITTHPLPVPVISQNGGILTLTESYDEYQWYLDGNAINGATGDTYNAVQNGDYHVVVSDEWGCEGTATSVSVIVDQINEQLAQQFVAYPNPATSVLNIEFNKIDKTNTLKIIDLTGNVVYQTSTNLPKIGIDVSAFSAGIYFVQVSNNNLAKTSKITIR